jgi:hypothetical protein
MIDVSKVRERWEDEVSGMTHVNAFRAGVVWVEEVATCEQANLVAGCDSKGGQLALQIPMAALNLTLEQTAERGAFWAERSIVCDEYHYPKDGAELAFLAGVRIAL